MVFEGPHQTVPAQEPVLPPCVRGATARRQCPRPNRKVSREQSPQQGLARPRHPHRSVAPGRQQGFGGAQRASGRRIRAVSEDQEFPLAHQHSDQIFATTDQLAERVRKIGGATLKSIGQVAKLQTIKDNNEDYVPPREMLRELMQDNKHVASAMRKAHDVCDDAGDVASASILEVFIDETERRTWFLFEATRQEGANEA
jgi:hypothetical protein